MRDREGAVWILAGAAKQWSVDFCYQFFLNSSTQLAPHLMASIFKRVQLDGEMLVN